MTKTKGSKRLVIPAAVTVAVVVVGSAVWSCGGHVVVTGDAGMGGAGGATTNVTTVAAA